MRRTSSSLTLCLGVFISLVLVAVPAALATSPTFTTSAVTKTAAVQGTFGGYKGVLVNYTSSLSSDMGGFAYMDLTNSAGETVAWNAGHCNFSSGATTQCLVLFPLSLASGRYTASIFVTTDTGVAISVTSAFQVSV